MRQVLSKGVLTAAAASSLLSLGSGAAQAHTGASAEAAHSPGILSGNSISAPITFAPNVCGNTVDGAALANPAMGNNCANGGQGRHRADSGGYGEAGPVHQSHEHGGYDRVQGARPTTAFEQFGYQNYAQQYYPAQQAIEPEAMPEVTDAQLLPAYEEPRPEPVRKHKAKHRKPDAEQLRAADEDCEETEAQAPPPVPQAQPEPQAAPHPRPERPEPPHLPEQSDEDCEETEAQAPPPVPQAQPEPRPEIDFPSWPEPHPMGPEAPEVEEPALEPVAHTVLPAPEPAPEPVRPPVTTQDQPPAAPAGDRPVAMTSGTTETTDAISPAPSPAPAASTPRLSAPQSPAQQVQPELAATGASGQPVGAAAAAAGLLLGGALLYRRSRPAAR
ncbi:chaplin [Streptomyces sp. NPDC006879]|uniref:chaplin n=1 Tax=Streptomyces sp. NPDC006879 TaxID=3364767 RepID=UPI0036D0BC06